MNSVTVLDRAREIAVVTAVDGWHITGAVRSSGDSAGEEQVLSHEAGDAEFGALVKVPAGESIVIGAISRIWSQESNSGQSTSRTMVEIEMLGELTGPSGGTSSRFQRGVSKYPKIGSRILEATSEDIGRVYATASAENVRIGSLYHDPRRPVNLLVDQLLGKHFAVLGTTGSGKSCSTALILHAVLDAYPKGHVIILDPHNEYRTAFAASAEILDPANLRLPYWLLNFEEAAATFCSQDPLTREYEAAILKEAIRSARRDFARARGGVNAQVGYITVDTPSPYLLDDALAVIEKGLGKLEKPGGALPYLRLIAKIDALRSDDRFSVMFVRDAVDDTLADIVCRLIRFPVDDKPVTIIDLSGVPSEIVDVVVSIISRMIFDFALWSAEPQAAPVLLVCEEAHRYVPRDEKLGFSPTRRAITRIAMEGRKYGVSLCLVSNRPSGLSPTMLAQCNTIFALRMSNQQDHDFIRSALPEGMGGLVGALPALRPQEAIVVGDGVGLPLRLRFSDLPEGKRPRSTTAQFSQAWKATEIGRDFVRETISRWRHQRRD